MKKLANRKSIQCFSHIKFGEKRKAKNMCLDGEALKSWATMSTHFRSTAHLKKLESLQRGILVVQLSTQANKRII